MKKETFELIGHIVNLIGLTAFLVLLIGIIINEVGGVL